MSILIGEMVSTGPRRLLFIALVILVLERLTLGGEHDSLNNSPPLENILLRLNTSYAGNLAL